MNKLTRHPNVYTPIRIGRLELKNRIMVPPMLPCLANPDGSASTELMAFAGRLAKSGAALVAIGETPIDCDRSYDHTNALNLGSDRYIPALSMLVDEIHRHGAKASIEINHSGACADEILLNGKVRYSPSPMPAYMHPLFAGQPVQIMDRAAMDLVKHNYLEAVRRCVVAGFDMIMIHAAHGWLIGQFLSPSFNMRTDEYGGDIHNRMRFPIEIISAISGHFRDKIAIDMRVSGSHLVPKHLSPHENDFGELEIFLKAAEPYLDMVNVSASFAPYLPSTERMIPSYLLPHKTNVEFAERIRQVLKIPVSIAGSITTLAEAEDILVAGHADMIGMARATLADPDIFVKGERGLDEEIRPCLRCCVCEARIEPPSCKAIRCAVNPHIGRELEYPDIPRPLRARNVMIIGGGPAGMEACQILTRAGHDVSLYEAGNRLGGMLHSASALPFKQDMHRYLDWMVRQTEKSGAAIHLETPATPELIRDTAPDVVLVAIGAEPFFPNVPIIDTMQLAWAADIDEGKVTPGDRIVVVGAGLTGVETAIGLARQGRKVTVIDRIGEQSFLAGTPGAVRLSVHRLVAELGVDIIFESSLKEITASGVIYETASGEQRLIECDTVAHALGLRFDRARVDELLCVVPETYVLGDCSGKKMTVENAVLDAFTIASRI